MTERRDVLRDHAFVGARRAVPLRSARGATLSPLTRSVIVRCVVLIALLATFLLTGCALLETPTATPLPTPTPTPTPVYAARAWVALSRLGWGERQTVYGELTADGVGVAGAEMYAVMHYQVGDRRAPEEGAASTGDDGVAAIEFGIDDAGSGYMAYIDVYLLYKGQTHTASTSFAPQC